MSLNECEQMIEHLPALQRYACTLTRDSDRADDLVQDCVERALTRWHLYEQGTNLRAWLFTICRRLFLNECRKTATRGVHIEYEDVRMAIPVKAQQEAKVELEELKSAFQTLPLNDKVVLSLITLEGLKYEEAAVLLNVPVGTIRSRLSRARSKLTVLLEGKEAISPTAPLAGAQTA